jgi:hypothetical protein
MGLIETDYLVIGAGTAGMAFADALHASSDADIVLVDRRHRPGGHWLDAYPFVRLHQPSAFYGVNSRVLGGDRIDESGPNTGFYQRATASEICDYFFQVLESLEASGRVRFFPMSDYVGDWSGGHTFTSRLTGEATQVRVRRRIVDATYLETSIPKTHVRPFRVETGVTCIPINDLVGLDGPASGYTVIGAGKTAMDACNWLLDNGVGSETIRWIRPRDPWLLDRAYTQPLEQVSWLMDGVALSMEAVALADDMGDLFRRLEASGQLVRLDHDVEPTMYRCATISTPELEALRRIEHVVRLGRVLAIGSNRIVLERGEIPTDARQVHVDCTAEGLATPPDRPMFEPHQITVQAMRTCQPSFNSALVGFIESLSIDDEGKNRLCPPNRYPSSANDWLRGFSGGGRAQARWATTPDVARWMEGSRLNGARGMAEHASEPRMKAAIDRYLESADPARTNAARLLTAMERDE